MSPTNTPEIADEHIDDAYAALERADLAAARVAHTEAIRAGADGLALGLLEVDLFEADGLHEEALAAAEALADAHPAESSAQLRFALILLDVFDEVGPALEILESIADAAPPDDEDDAAVRHEATLSLIDCLLAISDNRSALERAETLRTERPDDSAVRIALACAHYELRDFAASRAALDGIADGDADAADAAFLRGRVAVAAEDIAGARAAFAVAARLAGDRYEVPRAASPEDLEDALRAALAALPQSLDVRIDGVSLSVTDAVPGDPDSPGAPLTLRVEGDKVVEIVLHRDNVAIAALGSDLDELLDDELRGALAVAFDLDIDDVTGASA